jgi:hypothetical protein
VSGANIFSQRDREQITVAAFLNMFIAWEEFVEAAFADFMTGEATVGGMQPVKFVSPPSREHSVAMVIHTHRFFDFANHDSVRKLAGLYFQGGYPFDPTLSSITGELQDLKTIRNSCAHLSSSTRRALESLAGRIMAQPQPGIGVYQLLIAVDPRVPGNNTTVYAAYRDKLIAAATSIAQG